MRNPGFISKKRGRLSYCYSKLFILCKDATQANIKLSLLNTNFFVVFMFININLMQIKIHLTYPTFTEKFKWFIILYLIFSAVKHYLNHKFSIQHNGKSVVVLQLVYLKFLICFILFNFFCKTKLSSFGSAFCFTPSCIC